MDLVTVTPLAQITAKEELSYFTDKKIKVGSIVSVDIRNKEVPALVLKKEPVKEVKSRIKTSSYGFKKINSVLVDHFYSENLIEAAKETSKFYSAPMGGILKAVTPRSILESPIKTKKDKKPKGSEMKPETSVLQVSRDERVLFYKQHIRGVLARGKSVFICTPTKKDAEFLSKNLKKGIEHATFTFHGSMSDKDTVKHWRSSLKKDPKLVISTGLFLSLFNNSFESLILERESSDSYYSAKRPFFDMTFLARNLAKKTGAKFIAADTVLSVKTYKGYKEGHLTEAAPIQKKYRKGSQVSIVDMTMVSEKENPFMPFLCSLSLKKISTGLVKRSFVYTARRGLSPTTTCKDCGFTFSCSKCSAPLVLHQKNEKRLFICHACANSEIPKDLCLKCGSWRLVQLGVGSENIAEILQKAFPERNVIRMDSDSASSATKEEKLWQTFKKDSRSILVGTDMALNAIRSDNIEIGNVVVASIDSLLTYPNYSAGERVFRTLTELSLIAQENTVIQTRVSGQRLLTHIKNKENMGFFEDELEIRKKLLYPPFSIPITVTFSAKGFKIKEKKEYLKEKFRFFEPRFIPSISERKRGLSTKKMLVRVPVNVWPNRKLMDDLKSLSPEYKVAVDPPTII